MHSVNVIDCIYIYLVCQHLGMAMAFDSGIYMTCTTHLETRLIPQQFVTEVAVNELSAFQSTSMQAVMFHHTVSLYHISMIRYNPICL